MADQNGTFALFKKIKNLIDSEIDDRTRSFCRTRKMTVTTAYDAGTQLVGVSEAVGKEIKLPVFGSVDVSKLTVGTAVWVFAPYSSMSNAMVFMLGDGGTGYAESSEDANTLGGNPPSFYIPPVGIVLPFWDDTEPAAIWGGTWELLAEGRTLIQSGITYAIGSTGGEANHTLTVNEMPSHSGHLGNNSGYSLIGNATAKYLKGSVLSDYGTTSRGWNITDSEAYPAGVDRGGSQPHNNMPPYLAVNLWKRTA